MHNEIINLLRIQYIYNNFFFYLIYLPSNNELASHTETTPSAIPPTTKPEVKEELFGNPQVKEENRVRVFTL